MTPKLQLLEAQKARAQIESVAKQHEDAQKALGELDNSGFRRTTPESPNDDQRKGLAILHCKVIAKYGLPGNPRKKYVRS